MNKNNNILDAWIMTEYLSEANLKQTNKELLTLNKNIAKDYHDLCLKCILENNKKTNKSGVVLYFDIFNFNKIIDLVSSELSFEDTYNEIISTNKFCIALYFTDELKLLSKKTFISSSYYVLSNKKIPSYEEFNSFEQTIKNDIELLFDEKENTNYSETFNSAILNVFEKFCVSEAPSYSLKYLQNIDLDSNLLHSYFTKDLEKAKEISTVNLVKYLSGTTSERINLDSDLNSVNFNKDTLRDILMPNNYPLARFPSNPEYSLSLMQQIAVNLSINNDNDTLRSVNGPPGTGKTTLLKDVFAQLVMEQSLEISKLDNKNISLIIESNNIKIPSIGILPKIIADNGILVASSNNGAVKNIVDELPLSVDLYEIFKEELFKVNYFTNIASSINSDESMESNVDKNIPTTHWGLFSMEGGKNDNMKKILNVLERVISDLEKNYKSNSNVYSEYLKSYEELKEYNESVHIKSIKIIDIQKKLEKLKFEQENFIQDCSDAEKEIDEKIYSINKKIDNFNNKIQQLLKFRYKNSFIQVTHQFMTLIYTIKIKSYEKEKNTLRHSFRKWKNDLNTILEIKENNLKTTLEDIDFKSGSILDFDKSYDDLQLDNPWFDKEYRNKQSLLFIKALAVRKQFLYENLENIKTAKYIWINQNKMKYSEEIMKESWNWINMVIPVISTTFASVSNMFKNIGPDSIGRLYVDEAGQATPQACIGAIFRSKDITVVGDPSQIKPVFSIDSNIMRLITQIYKIPLNYLSEEASTQTIIDYISKYGFYKDAEKKEWIGIPLWVHRRCMYPMFNISNTISYNGKMVQGKKAKGKGEWLDVKGKSANKYVKDQGIYLKKKLLEMNKENPDILNLKCKDVVYIITPFKNIANQLVKVLSDDDINFVRYDENKKPTNVGTVHTFQGKEALIVFFVLGGDIGEMNAINWATGSENPNIMNVAATRAKEEFYIIGDEELYSKLNSTVINSTLNELYKFNNNDS